MSLQDKLQRSRPRGPVGPVPSIDRLEAELKREKYKNRYGSVLRSTVYTLVIVAAIAILTATLWLPVLQIYGESMTPTLEADNVVLSIKGEKFQTGDIIAFYFNNKILVKRVIASSGDWVDIDEYGTVYVNNRELDEPYVKEKALGECNIRLPYQVPESKVFVMGDHRSVSIDSRSNTIGCVSQEQIVGRLVFRLWPLNRLGSIQ